MKGNYDIISNSKKLNDVKYGEKAIRLFELRKEGFNVPDALLLSVEYIEELISKTDTTTKIKKLYTKKNKIKIFDKEIKTLFSDAHISVEKAAEIKGLIKGLKGYNGKRKLAVRSAGICEDNITSSFAGQYSTILNVDLENIIEAIFKCYSSWWNERAIKYREKNNINNFPPNLSIIIQVQLNPNVSGIIFTRNPINNNNTILIEAVQGIGEKLVSGISTPSRWELEPSNYKIINQYINEENVVLNYDTLSLIGKISKEIENKFFNSIDIEWAIEDGILYILQMRPITTISDQKKSNEEDGVYSRMIVEDLWSDKMTDITSTIIFDEFSDLYTFKTLLKKLRLYEIAKIKAIKVINGYGYLNVKPIRMAMELLPKKMRFRELLKVFPQNNREDILKIPFKYKKVLKLISRVPLLFNDLSIIPFFTSALLKKHLRKVNNELNEINIDQYNNQSLGFYNKEIERLLLLLQKLQIRNQWGYGNASIFTWIFRHFAVNTCKHSEEWVLSKVSEIPRNITSEMQIDLRELSLLVKNEIKNLFEEINDTNKLWRKISSEYSDHIFFKKVTDFIIKYKVRSANRDFIHPRWDEKPELVLDLISVLLYSECKEYKTEKIIIREKIGIFRKILTYPALNILLKLARKLIALREDLRFGLDAIFHRIRRLLLLISETPEFSCISSIENGIFFIELNELRQVLERKTDLNSLKGKIIARKELFEKEKYSSPPYYIQLFHESVIDLEKKIIYDKINGTPASSGIIEGPVCIIRNSSEFKKLKKGDVLVAFNTDPGWTPLFISAAAVVVEMGGILNHCAIVAREYGIPAVVGINKITEKLKDGQLIRVNGNTGVIEIIEETIS